MDRRLILPGLQTEIKIWYSFISFILAIVFGQNETKKKRQTRAS